MEINFLVGCLEQPFFSVLSSVTTDSVIYLKYWLHHVSFPAGEPIMASVCQLDHVHVLQSWLLRLHFYLFSLISHSFPTGILACLSNTAVFHTHYSAVFANAVPSVCPLYGLISVPLLPWSFFWPSWLRVFLPWDSIDLVNITDSIIIHCFITPTSHHISWTFKNSI